MIPKERQELLANVRNPQSLSELNCHICQFIYSSSYIGQFSKLVAPLRRVIKGNVFSWSKTENDAFQAIKILVALGFKNFAIKENLPVFLMIDSSKLATSYMLC